MAKSRAASAAGGDVLVGAVVRQRKEEIRATIRTVGTTRWLDLRIFFEDETGTMRPSQRGLSLSPSEWSQLKEILQRLKSERDGRPSVSAPGQPIANQ